MATQMPPFCRTQGDGMEKIDNETPTERTVILFKQEHNELPKTNLLKENNLHDKTTIKNLSSVVKLTPQAMDKKKKNILTNLKNKEPKFVPYEPYKAAVRPIVPQMTKKPCFMQSVKKKSKDLASIFNINKNVEVFEKIEELKTDNLLEENNKSVLKEVDWQAKLQALQSEIQTLRDENLQLENQLKFQVQVNAELKNLLVAAVGEDMETKVHVLTEDKLHLAQALLKSSESLTSNQERIEWLAGQCEVWRSKFLTSSVMVEELARWKASLCQKVTEAHNALKNFLEEDKEIREYVMQTYKNLIRLRDNFDLHSKKNKMTFSNIIEISKENLSLSNMLILELLGSEKSCHDTCKDPFNHWRKTSAEKSAEHILANPNYLRLVREPDAACNAVVGAAISLSGQLYLETHPPEIGCCSQCSGEIKLV